MMCICSHRSCPSRPNASCSRNHRCDMHTRALTRSHVHFPNCPPLARHPLWARTSTDERSKRRKKHRFKATDGEAAADVEDEVYDEEEEEEEEEEEDPGDARTQRTRKASTSQGDEEEEEEEEEEN